MKRIGIIDDQADARNLLSSLLEDALSNMELSDEWEVYATSPLPSMEEYPALINQQEICIFLVDERLGEVPNANGETVDYTGSSLVNLLRTQFKELPIYGVTAFPQDGSLEEYFSQFDEVIQRDELAGRTEGYLERWLRRYEEFLNANEQKLAELSSISGKIALGEASEAEKERAEAIQQDLEIPLITPYISSRREWLEEYAKIIDQYHALQSEVKELLSSRKKKDTK